MINACIAYKKKAQLASLLTWILSFSIKYETVTIKKIVLVNTKGKNMYLLYSVPIVNKLMMVSGIIKRVTYLNFLI